MRGSVRIGVGWLAALAIVLGAEPSGAQAIRGKARSKAAKKAEPPAEEPPGSGPRFSREIAPILVGNCVECHNAERLRGKFDLTTFEKLLKGSESGPVIVPGKPEESPLVLHIKGEEEPRMPPGDRRLAPEAIAKIESWVGAGARLDAGVDARADLKTIAPTPEQIRREELARLSPEERDERLAGVAKTRWAQANAKTTPEMTSGAHFVVFGTLPKERAEQAIKALEAQRARLRLLTGEAESEGAEKISVYIFDGVGPYVELARSVENRDVDASERARANLGVADPYLVAIEPQAGSDRSLPGLLVEQYAAGSLARSGKAPRWLTLGLGAYFASQVESRSPYYRKLRVGAARQAQLGWAARAQQALGGEADDEVVRAIGFSLVEYLASAWKPRLTPFLRGMIDDPRALDATLKNLWGADRPTFLGQWGAWVASSYGGRR